jgi:hypothetical protein
MSTSLIVTICGIALILLAIALFNISKRVRNAKDRVCLEALGGGSLFLGIVVFALATIIWLS